MGHAALGARITRATAALIGAVCLAATATRAVAGAPVAAAPASSDAKAVVTFRMQSGQSETQSTDTRFMGTPHGLSVVIETLLTSRLSYTAVAANGDVTLTDGAVKAKMFVNGTQQPDMKLEPADTYVVHPNGTLAAYTDGSGGMSPFHLSERMFVATEPVFPDHPVGVGEHWTYDYPANAALGLPVAHADFEIERREQIGGADTFEVAIKYAEEPGGSGIYSAGVIWVEVATGDPVRVRCRLRNVPLPAGPNATEPIVVDSTMTGARVGGSVVPASAGGK
jgi:hypothetical protein